MSKVVTFGEIMTRFSPPGFSRFGQAIPGTLRVNFAGAEANVAVGVASLGGVAKFVSAIPGNPIGDACVANLRSHSIETECIVRTENGRLGAFYVEAGINQRAGNVVYDRADSSFATTDATSYDWDAVFSDASWLFLSGITPAVSQTAMLAAEVAVAQARKRSISVAFDINYRSKLWNWRSGTKSQSLAAEILPGFISEVDLLFCGQSDAVTLLGYDRHVSVASTLKQLSNDYANLKLVASSLRTVASNGALQYGGGVYDASAEEYLTAPAARHGYPVESVVDRIGIGDAFAAGFLWALNSSTVDQQEGVSKRAIEVATAAGCLAHTIEGDFNLISPAEIDSLLSDEDTTGRVRR